jgi:hypothetical protein
MKDKLSISIDPELRAVIQKQAKENSRSFSGQLDWLLRRGMDNEQDVINAAIHQVEEFNKKYEQFRQTKL